jgi:hypothetical protein
MSRLVKLSEVLQSVDSPLGRQRVVAHLKSRPYPHYKPHPNKAGLLERIDENENLTMGRFVNRQFKPIRTVEVTAADM